ncbi:MAG: heavy metal translocating P-type ATPase [Methylococcaceae bacterium]|nr:heavy metal translocating P-type ATPase [Methylococcaceae bacterium]
MIARLFASKTLADVLTAPHPQAQGSVPSRMGQKEAQSSAIAIVDGFDRNQAKWAKVLTPSQASVAQWFEPPTQASPKPTTLANRHQQLDEMLTVEEKKQRRTIRKRSDRRVGVSLLSFGLITVGYWFWPLKLLGVAGMLYLTGHWYQKTFSLLRRGKVGIPTLMVVSLTGALACGYFLIASFVLIVAQLAQRLTAMVTADSRSNLIDIFRQAPKTAWLLVDGVEIQTPLEQVVPGETVIVGAGEVIPVDGFVLQGMGTVDQHLLTGEARPLEKGPSEPVFAGTVVLSGRLEITVEKAGEHTTVAQIGKILNATTEYKSTAQLRAEHLAQRTVAPTLIAGVVAVPVLGPMGALAVVDSHFRQRMSILAPVALMNYLNIAARHGILIKDGRSLDLLGKVDTLVFDKTGTLTEEQPAVGAIHVCGDSDARQILRYAACAEQKQAHPIAHAIRAEAARQQLDVPPLEEADYHLGYGLKVKVENHEVQVGSRRFMEALALTIPPALDPVHEECHRQGHSLVMVACDGALIGAIELVPTVRPEAKAIIAELRRRHGIKATYIISGDHEAPTRKLAEELGIDHYFAETLPENKAALIERLIGEGRFVCYIGDGINDAIALKKSHVSISLRGASSVAVDTAQIILMEGDLKNLTTLFDLAKGFHTNTDVAFAISVVPTVIGIGGAFFLHFTLVHTALLAVASIITGLANAMLPLVLHRTEPAARRAIAHEEGA